MIKYIAIACLLSTVSAFAVEDDKFVFQDDFHNLANVDPKYKDRATFNILWIRYAQMINLVQVPVVAPPSIPVTEKLQCVANVTVLHYAGLLSKMLQLRAFTEQAPITSMNPYQKTTLAKIDRILKDLDLHYMVGQDQFLVDKYKQAGLDQVKAEIDLLGKDQVPSRF